jgi:voltage-dependent calcium channel
MYGLVNMTLFLLLTNVIAGLIAIQLFRGDFNPTTANTEFTFKQVFNAFLAMYQVRASPRPWSSFPW